MWGGCKLSINKRRDNPGARANATNGGVSTKDMGVSEWAKRGGCEGVDAMGWLNGKKRAGRND
jgi:hypothetical protein